MNEVNYPRINPFFSHLNTKNISRRVLFVLFMWERCSFDLFVSWNLLTIERFPLESFWLFRSWWNWKCSSVVVVFLLLLWFQNWQYFLSISIVNLNGFFSFDVNERKIRLLIDGCSSCVLVSSRITDSLPIQNYINWTFSVRACACACVLSVIRNRQVNVLSKKILRRPHLTLSLWIRWCRSYREEEIEKNKYVSADGSMRRSKKRIFSSLLSKVYEWESFTILSTTFDPLSCINHSSID